MIDAAPLDAGRCASERCDGRDDDCDGRVDEDAICALDHASSACAAGACALEACDPGWADCNGAVADGCERDVTIDRGHCGACDAACAVTETCTDGVCTREQIVDFSLEYTACVVLATGRVLCWGRNDQGTVGLPPSDPVLEPTEVPGLSDAVAVEVGGSAVCALHRDRSVSCWGQNIGGALGRGFVEPISSHTPERVADLDDADALWRVVGSSAHCVGRRGGELWCWGNGADGSGALTVPQAFVGVRDVRELVGVSTACVVTSVGELWCWGENDTHRIAPEPSATRFPEPTLRRDLPGRVTTADCGRDHCCAIIGDELWCWGNDEFGSLGDGTPSRLPPDQGPTRVPTLVRPVEVRVARGARGATVARTADGRVFVWGADTFGIVGSGGPFSATPREIAELRGATAIRTATYGACAQLGASQLYCWGLGESGELGRGRLEGEPRSVPLPVLGFE